MFGWPRQLTLRITQSILPDRVVLSLKGNATSDLAPLWQNEFLRLSAERLRVLVLDLTELNSVSNLFLTALERLVECQQRHGGQVKVLRPRPVVREMLDLFELSHLVEGDEQAKNDHSGFMRVRNQ